MSQQKTRKPATGISNRESASEEAKERLEHPPLNGDRQLFQDAESGDGELPLNDQAGEQSSRKSGVHSSAQKEEGSRDPERPVPPSRPVAGAFGKEGG
jgi:hypothetical protein